MLFSYILISTNSAIAGRIMPLLIKNYGTKNTYISSVNNASSHQLGKRLHGHAARLLETEEMYDPPYVPAGMMTS